MFNNSLKKEALKIHEEMLTDYNSSYDLMGKACEELFSTREESVEIISMVQDVVNSIANTPKEYSTRMGIIESELKKFKATEEYAKEAYDASIKTGVNIVGGVATGMGVASMAPTALMSIATTFGTASTGTAISALSGAAAQKAAVAWLGRTFVGFAVKEGAGMAAGQAFLALAGPIGWGITATTTGISLISLTNKNKKMADNAVEEAKNIARARETLDEITEKVNALNTKTTAILKDMQNQKEKILSFMGKDYLTLAVDDKLFLGSMVNNTESLSLLLNETVE